MTTVVMTKKQVSFAYKRLACGFITLMSVNQTIHSFKVLETHTEDKIQPEHSENLSALNLTRDQFTLVHRLT